ncbi:MAG: hypothetical protein IJN31_07545 [Peptococcaceae bacterium]|nr:hypothetical protein [Peptococcaceae bacterium]MBQ7026443.1 hypothetical protein [Peptococcaceae bacterium]
MAEREHKFSSAMRDNEKKFFHNEDLQAGVDYETALKLGCFDKEFLYYAAAYLTPDGIACRVSAKERQIQQFMHDAMEQGLYPTPIKQYIRRLPAPSGHETKIKESVKKEAAEKVFALYDENYFNSLHQLTIIGASDSARVLLEQWREQLEGLYDRELLDLYQGLVYTALESKVLTVKSYLELKQWMSSIYKQLESDIIPKGQYKKTMTAFAYKKDDGEWKYFFDAWEAVAVNRKMEFDKQGYLTTPVFVRTKWLMDMNEFRVMRETFMRDYKAYCEKWYLNCFEQIKALPGVITAEQFDLMYQNVQEHCTAEAQTAFFVYRNRWNIK